MARKLVVAVVLLLLAVPALCGSRKLQQGSSENRKQAGKYKPHGNAADKVPDEFVVTLVEAADLDADTDDLTTKKGAEPKGKWGILGFKGFGAKVPPGRADELLAAWSADPRVVSITDNIVVTANPTQSPATWGLDRLDQPDLPLTSSYGYTSDGSGIWAYVIDSGIRATHVEFKTALGATTARVVSGVNTLRGRSTDDDNGHGTHCAGTIGGLTYGVAKAVTLVPVKALDRKGSGTAASVITGVSWAANDARVANSNKVISMSLGSSYYQPINDAVSNAFAAGVTVAVAAGNEATDACTRSPASAGPALTVGATTSSDAIASFSNYGACVDIFAPGVNITSAWNTNDTAIALLSGTSMATPHVAGVAARILSRGSCTTPTCVANDITSTAGVGKLTGSFSAPNLLLLFRDSSM